MCKKHLAYVLTTLLLINCGLTTNNAISAEATGMTSSTTTVSKENLPAKQNLSVKDGNVRTEEQEMLIQEMYAYREAEPIYDGFLQVFRTKIVPVMIEGEKASLKMFEFRQKEGEGTYIAEARKLDGKKVQEAFSKQIAELMSPTLNNCATILEKHRDIPLTPREKAEMFRIRDVLAEAQKNTSTTLAQNFSEQGALFDLECQKELGHALQQFVFLAANVLFKLPQEMNDRKMALLRDIKNYKEGVGIYDPYEEAFMKEYKRVSVVREECDEAKRKAAKAPNSVNR